MNDFSPIDPGAKHGEGPAKRMQAYSTCEGTHHSQQVGLMPRKISNYGWDKLFRIEEIGDKINNTGK